MKKKGNMTPPEVNNPALMDTNDNEVDEIPDKKKSKEWLQMINEIKEDTDNLNEFQEKINHSTK